MRKTILTLVLLLSYPGAVVKRAECGPRSGNTVLAPNSKKVKQAFRNAYEIERLPLFNRYWRKFGGNTLGKGGLEIAPNQTLFSSTGQIGLRTEIQGPHGNKTSTILWDGAGYVDMITERLERPGQRYTFQAHDDGSVTKELEVWENRNYFSVERGTIATAFVAASLDAPGRFIAVVKADGTVKHLSGTTPGHRPAINAGLKKLRRTEEGARLADLIAAAIVRKEAQEVPGEATPAAWLE